jgi:hypothetical protein
MGCGHFDFNLRVCRWLSYLKLSFRNSYLGKFEKASIAATFFTVNHCESQHRQHVPFFWAI